MAARKGSVQLAIIIAVLILLTGGIFVLKSLNKASSQPQPQQSASSSQALPAGNSDAALDSSLQNINGDMNQLSTDNSTIDQSLSDQPVDLSTQ